jgi:anti-sigma factor RsiW
MPPRSSGVPSRTTRPAVTQTASLCGVRAVISVFRGYWSAAFLALAGAGFAFIGAAVTRAIDLAKERRAEAAQARADHRRDLDETSRLAYAALLSIGRWQPPCDRDDL